MKTTGDDRHEVAQKSMLGKVGTGELEYSILFSGGPDSDSDSSMHLVVL